MEYTCLQPGPVVITALEDVMVYAYTLGGYLLDPDRVRKELSDLKYRLTEFGACFRDDIYYVVVYDFISRYCVQHERYMCR